jgi:DNA-binding CsgD family transcriptional regulator
VEPSGGGQQSSAIAGRQWLLSARPPFVGRSAEIQALSAQLEQVRAGQPRVVLIEGPPGIGKTGLVREFLSQLSGAAVLHASGDEWESGLSYGIVAQLLAEVNPSDLRQRVQTTDGPLPDPLVVGGQLLELMSELAAAQPVIVVIDDAQWADMASFQALTFALRRLRSDAVLAVIVARDETARVPDGLRRLSQERGLHISLGGLDDSELAELAQRMGGVALSRRAAKRLSDHTGGSPLHAGAMLDELGAEAIQHGSGGLPAPRSFAMVVLARLAGCSEPARALVEAASVLATEIPLSVVAAVADVADAGAAIEEAVAARLLEAAPSIPVMVRFTHPMARAAVYHHLGPGRRSALHSRAATTVNGPDSLAHRAAAALGEDEVLSAELDAHARANAARGALSSAGRDLLTAARLHGDRAVRERLVLDAIDLLLGSGDVVEAARAAQGVVDFADSPRRRYLEGHLALLQGRRAAAEETLHTAWRQCRPGVDGALCSLISTDLAQLYSAQLRSGDAAEWARRAIETSDDAEVTAAALAILVPCLGMIGRADEGLALVARPAPPDHPAPIAVEALFGRGVLRLWVDDLAEARADLAEVVARCRDRPASRTAIVALASLADVEYRLGAWDDSTTDAAVALSFMEDSDQRWLSAVLHSTSTWVAAPRGEWSDAERHARAALAASEALGDPLSTFCAAAANAHVAFFQEDYGRAVDLLAPLYQGDIEDMPEEPGIHPWRQVHGEALLRLGRIAEARAAVEVFARLAVSRQRRSAIAYVERLRALIAAAEGDHDVATKSFEAARTQFANLGMPFESAMSEDAYGRFLRRTGQRRAAGAHLEAALEVYTRLGARPLIAPCEAELAGCGLTPRRRRDVGPPQLTPQEQAVARLVAAGRSNREAAAELVLSVKTIEHHLSAVYTKLGVRSRSQLTARMAGRPS